MSIEVRGWGLENNRLGGAPRQNDSQAVRDLIREDLPNIIEAALGKWLSTYEKKQQAWLQEMFQKQQTAAQAAQNAAMAQLWEGKVYELAESIERYHHAVDGIVRQTTAVVKETMMDATKDAVRDAMSQMPSEFSKWADTTPFSGASQTPTFVSRPKNQMGTFSAQPTGRMETAPPTQSLTGELETSISGKMAPKRSLTSSTTTTMASGASAEGPPRTFVQKVRTRVANIQKIKRDFVQRQREAYLADRAYTQSGRTSNFAYCVNSFAFEAVIMVVILLHVVYMIYDADHFQVEATWGHVGIEVFFLLVYIVELILKISVEKLYFFTGPAQKLHLLDVFLVVTGFIDIVAQSLSRAKVVGAMPLKVLRMVMLNRLARTQRLFLYSKDLQILIKSLVACAQSLWGPLFILIGYFLVVSLWFVPQVSRYLTEFGDTLTSIEGKFYEDSFGSVARSMFTLYGALSGGANWMPVYRPLSKINTFLGGVAFVLCHFIFVFLMVNVVLCLFIGKIVLFSLDQTQALRHDQRRQDGQDVKWILAWCEVEYGHGNTINYKDFLNLMHRPELRTLFTSRGVHIDDTQVIFKAFAPETTQEDTAREWEFNIDRKAFFDACMRLKREVTTMDIMAANAFFMRSMERQQALTEEAMQTVQNLGENVKAAMKTRETGRPLTGPNARR